jgi:hypothetical protein
MHGSGPPLAMFTLWTRAQHTWQAESLHPEQRKTSSGDVDGVLTTGDSCPLGSERASGEKDSGCSGATCCETGAASSAIADLERDKRNVFQDGTLGCTERTGCCLLGRL